MVFFENRIDEIVALLSSDEDRCEDTGEEHHIARGKNGAVALYFHVEQFREMSPLKSAIICMEVFLLFAILWFILSYS